MSPESRLTRIVPALFLLGIAAIYIAKAGPIREPTPFGNIGIPQPPPPSFFSIPESVPIQPPRVFENVRIVPEDPTACNRPLLLSDVAGPEVKAKGPEIQFNHFALLPSTPPGMTEVGIIAVDGPPVSEIDAPSALVVELHLENGKTVITGAERLQLPQDEKICAVRYYRDTVGGKKLTKERISGYRIPALKR